MGGPCLVCVGDDVQDVPGTEPVGPVLFYASDLNVDKGQHRSKRNALHYDCCNAAGAADQLLQRSIHVLVLQAGRSSLQYFETED